MALFDNRHLAVREWAIGSRPTTLQMPGGGYIKTVDRFDARHTETEEKFHEFLQECAEFGVPRPSSYNAVFHHCFRSPRVRRTFNQLFEYCFVGGWEEAKMTGVLPGRWKKYDLNSAYMWAVTCGLPVVESLRLSKHIGRLHGLYNLELERQLEHLPYPFNTHRFVNATTEEIDQYSLPIKNVLGGLTWSDVQSGDRITDTIKQFSFAKEVSKTFWGRWCSVTPITCRTQAKEWDLRNPILNLLWAHMLVGRVKRRVWSESKNAAHIFVDSIITTDDLPVGDKLGDWKHEFTYENGVKVRHPGYYGPADGNWDRTSGVVRCATPLDAVSVSPQPAQAEGQGKNPTG